MGRKIDLTGQTFGRWTVVSEAPKNKHKQRMWKCQCSCGTQRAVSTTNLKQGISTNCGCLRTASIVAATLTHGMTGSRLYGVWRNMKERCLNPSNPRYRDYGGRGITVCERWQAFENFRDDLLGSYEQHVKEYGESNTTIDRIDVNGNYKPSNVRWATYEVQNRNKRNIKSV